jgi:hypothetical protein
VFLVAAVVVGGVGYYLYQNYQEESTGSDYSLLDEDKIAPGLICKSVTELDGDKSTSKATVTSVIGGNVTYMVNQNSTDDDYEYKELSDFAPSSFDITFDYTDPSAVPSGVSVTPSGNTYTINGKLTTYMGAEYKYESLKIVYDGANVTSVNGKYSYTTLSGSSVSSYSMKTTDGVFKCSYSYQSSVEKTKPISEFFEDVFVKYDPSNYAGMSVDKEENYRYDGIKVTKYTVNGTDSYGTVYKDFEIYVYKDYQIKMEGKASSAGVQHTMKMVCSIYMDD